MATSGTSDSRWGPRSGEPGSAFHGLGSGRGGGRGGRGRGGAPRGGHGGPAPRGGGGGGGGRNSNNGAPATPPTRHTPLAIATANSTDAGNRKAPGSPRLSAARRHSLRAGAGGGAGAVPSSPLVPSASLTSAPGSAGAKADSASKDAPAAAKKMDAPVGANTDSGAAATGTNKNSSRRKRSGVGKPKNNAPLSPSSSGHSKGASLSSLSTALRHGSSPLSAREKERDDDVPSLLKRMNMDTPAAPSISARERDRERDRDRERQRRGSKAPAPVPPPINVPKVNKDLPPHLATRGVPHTAPLFPSSSTPSTTLSTSVAAPQPLTPLRTDIAAFVEHMRASAMTTTDRDGGSAAASVNGDHHSHHHIDWAGDDDDSLPDLDDWGVSRERLHLEPVDAGEAKAEGAEAEAGEEEEAGHEEGAEEATEEGEGVEEVEEDDGDVAQDHDGLISPLLTMSGLRALPDVHADDNNANSITVEAEAGDEDDTAPATPRAGSDSISSLSTAASISTAPTTASSSNSSANASSASVSASTSSSTPQSQSQSWRMPLHPSLPAKPVVAPPPVVQLPMAATPMRAKEQVHHPAKPELRKPVEVEGVVGDGNNDAVRDETETEDKEKGAAEAKGVEAGKDEGGGPEEELVVVAAEEEITTTASLPLPPALPLSAPALAPFLSHALPTTGSASVPEQAPVVVVVESESQRKSANPSPNPPRLPGLAASIHAPKEIQSTYSAPAHISTWADAMDAEDLEASVDKQPESEGDAAVEVGAGAEVEAPVRGVMASMHAFTPSPTTPSLRLASSTSGGVGRNRPPREHHRERSSRAGGRHNNNVNGNTSTLQPRAEGGRWSSLSHNDSGRSPGVPPHMRGGGRGGGGLSAGQLNSTHARTHSTPPPGSSHTEGSDGGPRSAPSWGGSQGPNHGGRGGHGGGGGSGGGSWNSGGAYSGAYNLHERYGRTDAGHGHVKRPVITGAAITQLARTIGKGGAGGASSATGVNGGTVPSKE